MKGTPNTRGSTSPSSSSRPTLRPIPSRTTSTFSTPKKKPGSSQSLEGNLGSVESKNSFSKMDLEDHMQLEKALYPGAKTWAGDEERLFEILFLRQDLPMLPSFWDVDFSGVPISDVIFETSEQYPPIVYAHDKDYKATTALVRLIDLTSSVRTCIQSGLRRKVPRVIKRELDKYLNWAAQDGGYHHLRIVPNIVTEVIDSKMSGEQITNFMQTRMRTLACLQREFFKAGSGARFWNVVKPKLMRTPKIKLKDDDTPLSLRRLLAANTDYERTPSRSPSIRPNIKVEFGTKRQLFKTPPDSDELSKDHDINTRPKKKPRNSPATKQLGAIEGKQATPPITGTNIPSTPKSTPEPVNTAKFSRQPPVVYGLFVLNTSVFLLTMDSSQGDSSYVSFHVETDFQDNHQGVWNALTIAIAACRARDELMTRLEDFVPLPVEYESDPDA